MSNRLLDALSPGARKAIHGSITAVPLPVGTSIFEAGVASRHFYFLTSGIASVLSETAEGEVVEVELFGREALPGSLSLLGQLVRPTRCVMQVAGTGLQISSKDLFQQFWSNTELQRRVLQHVQYKAFTLCQVSACNLLHGAEQRLARLLLMVADRLEMQRLPLTHVSLAEMLGMRRPTVTTIASALKNSGVIDYHRGHIQIVDRDALERTACECYREIRKLYTDVYADLTEPARALKTWNLKRGATNISTDLTVRSQRVQSARLVDN